MVMINVFLPILGELLQYGLTEEVLKEAFSQSAEDQESCWSLNKIPTIGFYRELHNFLKKWPSSHSATKTAIGKFYIQIDPELRIKSTTSCRPDNIFQFIEKVAFSSKPHSMLMSYGTHATIQLLQNEVRGCSTEIQELSAKVMEQEQELSAIKREVGIAREELDHTSTISRCGCLQFLWNLIDGTLFLALPHFSKTFMKGNTK